MERPKERDSAGRRAQNRGRSGRRGYARVRARPILAGSRYKVTRRCLERRLFLAPGGDSRVRDFVGYCLAYAANKYGVEIHAAVVMSNHYHVDLTDPHGELVAFKQLFNSMVARGLNALRGRFDRFWSSDGACDTRRPDDDQGFADLVYTLVNPVAAGLVKWSRQWPGLSTVGWRFGEARWFPRPEGFFDPAGGMPEAVSLTLVRPRVFVELDDDELYAKLSAAVRDAEVRAQAEIRERGGRFSGVGKVMRQGWRAAAKSFEERFRVAPKIAASSKWVRLAQLQRDRMWEQAYARARELWLAGEKAVFPAGTYWLRRFAAVEVAGESG